MSLHSPHVQRHNYSGFVGLKLCPLQQKNKSGLLCRAPSIEKGIFLSDKKGMK